MNNNECTIIFPLEHTDWALSNLKDSLGRNMGQATREILDSFFAQKLQQGCIGFPKNVLKERKVNEKRIIIHVDKTCHHKIMNMQRFLSEKYFVNVSLGKIVKTIMQFAVDDISNQDVSLYEQLCTFNDVDVQEETPYPNKNSLLEIPLISMEELDELCEGYPTSSRFTIEALFTKVGSKAEVENVLDKYGNAKTIGFDLQRDGKAVFLDRLSVSCDLKSNQLEGSLENQALSQANVIVTQSVIDKCEDLKVRPVLGICTASYIRKDKKNYIVITSFVPMEITFSWDDLVELRGKYGLHDWVNIILDTIGLNSQFYVEKEYRLMYLARMMPFVQTNHNLSDFGIRCTGKTTQYRNFPNASIISSGEISNASLFHNNAFKRNRKESLGIVHTSEVAVFDEIASLSGLKNDLINQINIMKDYMNDGSYSRGGHDYVAHCSFVFNGNTTIFEDDNVFAAFSNLVFHDTAFQDRFHASLPGEKFGVLKADSFSNNIGLSKHLLSRIFHTMRKNEMSDLIFEYYTLDKSLTQRDVESIKKNFSALMKLLFVDKSFVTQKDVEEVLIIAMKLRKRVKDSLKKVNPEEFGNVQFAFSEKNRNNKKDRTVRIDITASNIESESIRLDI